MIRKLFTATGVLVAMVTALTGCTPAAENAAPAIVVTDAWVKAIPDLAVDGDMTGVFMALENTADEDISVTGGIDTTGLTEAPLEAHEVVANDAGEMVMQMAEGGILVPAGGSVQLMPGGFHIMYWNVTTPIAVGDTITLTLNLSNGETVEVSAIAMTLDSGIETYVPNSGGMND